MARPKKEAPAVEPNAESEAPAVEPKQKARQKVEHRFEEFEATRPDGVVVVVRRNIDTGEQSVTEK